MIPRSARTSYMSPPRQGTLYEPSSYGTSDDETSFSSSFFQGNTKLLRSMNGSFNDTQLRGTDRVYHSPNTLAALRRREKHLQANLQDLLDAQSDGLLRGLRGDDVGIRETTDIASSESTLRPMDINPISPARVRKKNSRSLKRARKDIWLVMRDLALVKSNEAEALAADEAANTAVLTQMDEWDQKREGLDAELDRIEHRSKDTKRAAAARAETKVLEREIHELEGKLSELRTRHKYAQQEAETLENRVQAQLSSFKEARTLLDKDIREFVRNPPPQQSAFLRESGNRGGKGKLNNDEGGALSFTAIPPKRRTYELAKEIWSAERKELQLTMERIVLEREALEEGSKLWQDVVNLIITFETDLSNALRQVSQDQSVISAPSPIGTTFHENVPNLTQFISRMDSTVKDIEDAYSFAKHKGWKLLLCCIGAELEAFKQGQQLLRDSSTLDNTKNHSSYSNTDPEDNGTNDFADEPNDDDEDITDKPITHSRKGSAALFNFRDAVTADDEDADVDEEPDPELLITQR